MLVHRDYSVEAPSRLVFQKERLTFENPSRPRKGGLVDLAWSNPAPQNPTLYRFFREIGFVSESTTGFRKLLRHGEPYFGTQILAFDREIFKIIVTSNVEFPVRHENSSFAMQDFHFDNLAMQVLPWRHIEPFGLVPRKEVKAMQDEPDTMQDVSGVETQPERIRRILSFCESPRNREEIQKHVGLNNRDHFRKEILLPLLQKGLLLATLPDKPNSPKQQYRTAPAFVSREP
jgi:ATP-dependent DNA helicase RecG